MIRSLDIRKGERYTPGRVALHMALATAPEATLARPKPRRSRLWNWLAALYLLPPAVAVMVGVSLWLLRRIAT